MTETKKTVKKTSATRKTSPSKVVTTKKTVKKPAKAPVRSAKATTEQVKELLTFIQNKLDEGKAENIVAIDLAGKTSFADYIMIATGTSSRHVFGLANNLATDLKKAGYRVQVSGDTGDGNWVVIDAIDIVIHLFTQETRTTYKLEAFWNGEEDIK